MTFWKWIVPTTQFLWLFQNEHDSNIQVFKFLKFPMSLVYPRHIYTCQCKYQCPIHIQYGSALALKCMCFIDKHNQTIANIKELCGTIIAYVHKEEGKRFLLTKGNGLWLYFPIENPSQRIMIILYFPIENPSQKYLWSIDWVSWLLLALNYKCFSWSVYKDHSL